MNILRAVGEQMGIFSSLNSARAKQGSFKYPDREVADLDTAHSIARAVETEIPHCCFYCSWCGLPILLPHESAGLPFGGPAVRRIEARSIGTVCTACGHVAAYSLFRGCYGYDTRHKFMPARLKGRTVLLDSLPCKEETCVFPLPFFVTFDAEFSEENIKQFAAKWCWDDLVCPAGHFVEAPKWLFEAGPYRGSRDLMKLGVPRAR
jgi:hypothetical protein